MSPVARISERWSVAKRYLLAAAIFCIAIGLRLAIMPRAPGWTFVTFYPALTVAAVFCGAGAGVAVSVASALAAYFLLLLPSPSLAFDRDAAAAAAIFFATALGIVWVVWRMHVYAGRSRVAAAKAHASELRYLAVIEDMTDLIQRYSPDGALVFVNGAFCRTIGKTRDEILGTFWSRYLLDEDAAEVRAQNARLTPANPIITVECRFPRPDGEIRWVQLVNRALFDGDGRLQEIQSAGRDVTEHKRLEAEIETARNTAVQANEFKSRFLASASHDLRQPLQTIWSLHTVLSRSLAGGPLQPSLVLLEEAVRYLDDTLAALMDVNRLEQGVIVPVQRDFGLTEMLHRLRADFALAASGRGLELTIEDSAEVVHSDPTLLPVILRNLLANAIKYTQRGAVRLRVRRDGARLAIDVIDTGVGIEPEHLPRIFDAFYRVDATGLDQRRGVGLGLSIVQSLCHLLDHEMRIESEVGRGSTFTVILARGAALEAAPEPAAASPDAWAPGGPPPVAPGGSRSRRCTILHVEDDVGVARSMGLLLSLEGYTVVHAASRAEALRRVEEGVRPDLILCDFHLQQGQTGDQVVGELAEALGRKPPTIVLTGDISDRQIGKARAVADRILPKPVDIDVLLREFDGLLDAIPSAPAPLPLH